MSIEYSIEEDGRIFRDDGTGPIIVATKTEKGVEYYEGAKRFAPGVQKFLREEFPPEESAKDQASGSGPLSPKEFTVEDAQALLREKGLLPVVPQAKTDTLPWRTDASIPPAPELDKMDGDKTPAYVDWVERYHPEVYLILYRIEGPGLVTKKRSAFDKNGRPIVESYTESAILAGRKTHRTEKITSKA
jgi:hypothetical protein